MLQAVFMLGGLGLLVGIGLAVASKVFYVYVDPLVLAVDDALPGANCGGCGLPGCTANAEAIVEGKAAPNSCVAAGEETAIAIAGIMGVSIEAKEPDIAKPGCTYGIADADVKFIYDGLYDCRAASMLNGGMKVCTVGCLGLGTCARACPFDAIVMGAKGLPEVIDEKCTGCGTCERVCPKSIINLSSVTRRILKEYTTQECTTPCQRACPAGINICEYIKQIDKGDHHRAVQVIKERNPFPAIIGRICPRPCEIDCRRNLVDESVAINFLKRYAADYERKTGKRVQPYKAPDTGRRVAVIGGGIEGLSTAFFSARLGHDAAVFEATSQLGGLLRSAIADYRLPPEILDWDIEGVLEMGVRAETNMSLGKDIAIHGLLKEGYDAIFLAAGGWDSRLARGASGQIEEPIPSTYLLLDAMKAGEGEEPAMTLSTDVVLVGGGNLVPEAIARFKKMGAEKITVVHRETREASGIGSDKIETLEAQGVVFLFGSAVNRLIGEEDNLSELETINLKTLETDILKAGNLIFAAGRLPELVFIKAPVDSEEGEPDDESGEEAAVAGPLQWHGVSPYKNPALVNEVGLFAKGDVLTDYSGAIKAIAAGRRSAATLHMIMYGIPLALPEDVVTPGCYVQNVDCVDSVAEVPRQIMPLAPGQNLAVHGEFEKGFSEEAAKEEAARCLQCGLVCYERTGAVAIKEVVNQ